MSKPFLTINEQVELLKSRDMRVDGSTASILAREGYYSIVNGYKDPFLDRDATQAAHDDRFVLEISESSSTPTALIPLEAPDQPTKILQNDQIFILRGDKTYTFTGQEVK